MKNSLILAHGQTLAALRKCLILFTMLLAVGLSARAVEFEVGDLRYNVISEPDRTVEVCGYVGEPVEVVIPETVENGGVQYGVISIGGAAFKDCTSLTSITIPNSVTLIGAGAFNNCTSLTSVTIPNSVTSLGASAFYGCTSLTSVTLSESMTSVENSTFWECSSLASINIPESVTRIGKQVFFQCSSLASVSIPNSVTSIGTYAFRDCISLTSVTIPNSVKNIERCLFWGCSSLAEVSLSESLTTLTECTFFKCSSLVSVNIPNSVTTMGYSVFLGCSSLPSITIPGSLTSIGNEAFNGCTSLKTIYSEPQTPPEAGDYVFADVPEDAVVYVPEGSIAAYSAAKEWSRFFDFRDMPTTGVSELDVDCDARPADIYNMQGMLVKARASQDDIDALAPGLYIIAGRKVLVK